MSGALVVKDNISKNSKFKNAAIIKKILGKPAQSKESKHSAQQSKGSPLFSKNKKGVSKTRFLSNKKNTKASKSSDIYYDSMDVNGNARSRNHYENEHNTRLATSLPTILLKNPKKKINKGRVTFADLQQEKPTQTRSSILSFISQSLISLSIVEDRSDIQPPPTSMKLISDEQRFIENLYKSCASNKIHNMLTSYSQDKLLGRPSFFLFEDEHTLPNANGALDEIEDIPSAINDEQLIEDEPFIENKNSNKIEI